MVIEKSLGEKLQKAIQSEIDRVVTEELDKVKASVERKVRERVGQIAAIVCEKISYQFIGQEMVIRVKFEDFKTWEQEKS